MGGYGSGGWNHSGRATIEQRRRIDVASYRRLGALTNGWRGWTRWTCEGETTGSIDIIGGRDQIVLVYQISRSDGAKQDVRQIVRIDWSPCRLGGEQPHFLCPACDHRRRHLYAAWPHFLCRTCAKLTYSSRREREMDRAHRRVRMLRQRLIGDVDRHAPLVRPKHMHRATHERLFNAIIEAELEADDWFIAGAARLLRRGRPKRFWR